MNKSAIQKFAMWARTTLMEQVAQRAYQYGITKDGYGEENAITVNGMALSPQEQSQRRELLREIQAKGYDQVIEEVAYTWFNRFIALRYMEVNNYLPSHIRVFSNAQGAFDPEILKVAHQIDLPELDQGKVAEYIEKSETEALYRYLLLTQCNALNEGLPKIFEKMGGYTELLFPNNILRQDSVLGRMVADIPEEDWTDQVQIIGWLYQYYNTELKAETFDLLKKNVKVTKERIPSATQLFTPDWIVRYMVENSLGRLWLEGHPNPALRENWKYYLDEAEQEPEVEAQLVVLRAQRQTLRPEDITLIDPCMGSGHILVYAFDVLMQIYESEGWSQRDAAAAIVQKNLYGLDIDRRAAQLAYFAVMMKARQYDRRFLIRGIQPNLYHPGTYADGQEFGSLLMVDELEPKPEQPDEITLFDSNYEEKLNTWNFRSLLARQYDVVVTNPPYMSSSNMGKGLLNFIKKNYADGKNDLFAAFILRSLALLKKDGFIAMITMHSWMFLSRYQSLRQYILNYAINNILHLGTHAFEDIGGEVVQTASFIVQKIHLSDYIGRYERLTEYGDIESKINNLKSPKITFFCHQKNYKYMVDNIIAYWVSEKIGYHFSATPLLGDAADCRQGIATGDNDLFLRYWQEVALGKINFCANSQENMISSRKLYVPYNKGGSFRRWFGNREYVIKMDNYNYALLLTMGNHLPSRQYYYCKGITWNDLSTALYCARYVDKGFVFDAAGPTCFYNGNKKYLLAFLNSNVAQAFLNVICQGLHYSTGHIPNIPFIVDQEDKVSNICTNNLFISEMDWNSYETSWDFSRHPLV